MKRLVVCLIVIMLLAVTAQAFAAGHKMYSASADACVSKGMISDKNIFDEMIITINGKDKKFGTFLRMRFGRDAKFCKHGIFVNELGLYECRIRKHEKTYKVLIDLASAKVYVPKSDSEIFVYPIKQSGDFKCFVLNVSQLKRFVRDNKNLFMCRNLPRGYKKFLRDFRKNIKDIEYFVIQGSDKAEFFDVTAVSKAGGELEYVYIIGSGAGDRDLSKDNMLLYKEEYGDYCDGLINTLGRNNLISELEDEYTTV